MDRIYKNKIIEINFYFPKIKNISPNEVASRIIEDIKKDNNQNFLGYSSLDSFKKDLEFRLGNKIIKEINLDKKTKERITECIISLQKEFEKELKFKYKPIKYFIFPWFPNKKTSKNFGGSTGVATYFTVIHLFLDLENFSIKSFKETLAHELNHLYFYEIHNKFILNIKESLILEGLAENFREKLVSGKVAPWSKYLSKKEIQLAIPKLEKFYNSTIRKNHDEIFYGGGDFKKWTGYSVGYFLVRKFLAKNTNKTWKAIMCTKIDRFFE